MAKKIPSSLFARSSALLGMAAKIGAKEVGGAIKRFDVDGKFQTRLQQAKIAAETLGRMKGAAMKVGQLLSLDSSDLLPPELKKVFEPLQSSSPLNMGNETVVKILKEDFPKNFPLLESLSTEPIAAASIGQVHSATYQGKEIAIKIQYPGIADSISTDLSLLRKILKTALFANNKNIDFDKFFEELEVNLKNEADYRLEIENFRKYSKKIPEKKGWRYPVAIEDFCSQRVISYELEEGVGISQWLKTEPSFESRTQLAESLMELYCEEFFVQGIVQTDPNPSNFLVDKKDQLIIIDFGSVKEFDDNYIGTYRELMEAVRKDDFEKSLRVSEEFDLIDPRESKTTKKLFYAMIRSSIQVFDPKNQPFDFTSADYLAQAKNTTQNFMKAVEHSAPPHHLIFLHRKLGGLFFILRDLGVSMDLSSFYEDAVIKRHNASLSS